MSYGPERSPNNAPPTEVCLPLWEEAWRALTLQQQRMHHAFHEAGHAVVAWHFRFPIRSVSIESLGNTRGRVRYASSLNSRDKRLQLAAIEAGRLTVSCLCRREGWDPSLAEKGTAGDEDAAFDLALSLLGATRHRAPAQTAAEWIERVGVPVLKELGKASHRARDVLEAPQYWHAVEQVASALLEQSTITGEQACLLIETAVREGQQKANAAA